MTQPLAGPRCAAANLPTWFQPIAQVAQAADDSNPGPLGWLVPPEDANPRVAAVLLLFGESDGEPDVLLTERAAGLRSHAGQAAFPGGAIDPDDDGPVGAALREAAEETGLDASGVDVITTMPRLFVPQSNHAVIPVLAWWRQPGDVRVLDVTEVASVHRVPLAELLDPSNRLQVARRSTGLPGPAFRVQGLLVWGFTAGVLSRLFEAAEIAEPWDRTYVEDPPAVDIDAADGRAAP